MELARKARLAGLALAGLLLSVGCAQAQLRSLNQVGGTPCIAGLWLYGSALNGAGDAIPSCFASGGTNEGPNGTGTTFTNGSVLFAGTVASSSGGVTQDNANFFWDLADHRLGIATTAPKSSVDILGNLAVGSYAGSTAAPSDGAIISGSVGIGTSSPNTALDVAGDITDRNVTSCGSGHALRTDGTGKLICQALSCSLSAPSASCSCSDTLGGTCTCSVTLSGGSCSVN